MRVINKIKGMLCGAAVAVALGLAAVGTGASAATIVNQPVITRKNAVRTVGDETSMSGITNLKINGKAVSKSKSKVKTICTSSTTQGFYLPGDGTRYVNDDVARQFETDMEDYYQSQDKDKWIATGDYTFRFLKAGTYKISYDRYSSGDTKTVTSEDGYKETITREVKKTHYVQVYKVLSTSNVLKKVVLGKNKITYTEKNSGVKGSTKTVVNYRFLQGAKGKLTLTLNKNYKLTNGYAITYAENGDVIYTPVKNKGNVTYGAYKSVYKNEAKKDVIGADGTKTKDADGNVVRETYITSQGSSKYKPTDIYMGYKDTFTGGYTDYAVSNITVYQHKCDENGSEMYQKNADGTDVKDAEGNRVPVIEAVTATVLTTSYLERGQVNGAYTNINVVKTQTILPASVVKANNTSEYYLDAACKDISRYNYYTETSKNGIPEQIVVTYKSDYSTYTYKYTTGNPVYNRTFASHSSVGSWQPVESGDDTYADIDPATGKRTQFWKWVEVENEGKTTPIVDTAPVSLNSSDNYIYLPFDRK